MLTRLYIDNYRCFVNFEYRLSRKQLVFGGNGSGKSSFLDALLAVRQFAVDGKSAEDLFPTSSLTRWDNRLEQTFEIEAELDDSRYVYRLALDRWGEPSKPRVLSETVKCDGKSIFEFVKGEVHLFNDRFEHKVTYDFDWSRSAFETVVSRKDNQTLTKFKVWLGRVFCFALNPFAVDNKAEREDHSPNVNLSNLAAWYRHLSQSEPQATQDLWNSLREAMEGFEIFRLESVGEKARLLVAEFKTEGATQSGFSLADLSDGQRVPHLPLRDPPLSCKEGGHSCIR